MHKIDWKKVKVGFTDYFKTNYKDWHWWFKLISFLLVFTGLLIDLISGISNIQTENYKNAAGEWVPKWAINDVEGVRWDYNGEVAMYFSYFTNQSNFLVMIWLLYALIFPKKEGKGKLLGFTGSLLVATYISITCIIWTFMLFPASLANQTQYPAEEWYVRIVLHLITPILFVIYVVLFMKKETTVKTMEWLKRSWMIMIYPVIYGIVMLLRGEARYQSGFNSPSSYPYFFLYLHETVFGVPGWAWFIIAIIAIIAIAVGFSTLYVWSINYHRAKIARKLNDPNPTNSSNDDNSSSNNGGGTNGSGSSEDKPETPNPTTPQSSNNEPSSIGEPVEQVPYDPNDPSQQA